MSHPLLRLDSIEIETIADGNPIVRGASLEVCAGEMVALVGESGSGKTMTALAAIGLLPAGLSLVKGSVRIEDLECAGMSSSQWRSMRGSKIAMVFQEPMTALDPVCSIGELFDEVLGLDGISRRSRRSQAIQLLEEVRVPHPSGCLRRVPHELSGGMRQRVVIALALARSPSILLADEPTTALDAVTTQAIMDLLEQLCISRSLGVLLVTHDLGLVMRRANALVVLHSGHVCESGATEKVLGSPRHPYTKGLMACRLPLSTRQEPLGGLEKVMGSDEEWEPQSTPEGLLRPWRPSESTVGGARPRLLEVDEDHFLAV